MDTVANYVIRIYRFEKDRPRSLGGVVVEAGKNGKRAFQSYDELWEILNDLPGGKVHRDKPTGSGKGGDH
jgi:hypothetical protein